jgi:ABC-type amino acid transport substrate-binding protein
MIQIQFSQFFIKAYRVLLFGLLPLNTFATERESIIFGALDIPPFIIVSADDNSVKGRVPELLESIFLPLGFTIEYKLLSVPRVKKQLKSGMIDAFPLMLTTSGKGNAIHLSDVYLTSNDYIWATHAKYPEGIQWASLDDLKGKTFGIVSGASYGKHANSFIAANKHLFYVSDTSELSIKLLLANRVDGIFHNEDIVMDYLVRNRLDNTLVKSDKVLYSNQYKIGISLKSSFAKQIKNINQQIEKINTATQ